MAQISEQQKQIESQFMAEYWALRKAIATTETTDEYWEFAYKSLTELEWKYSAADPQNALYYKGIILACSNDLQAKDQTRRYKAGIQADFVRGINALRSISGLPLVEVQGEKQK